MSSFARRKGRGRPSVAVREAMAEAASLSTGDNAVSYHSNNSIIYIILYQTIVKLNSIIYIQHDYYY